MSYPAGGNFLRLDCGVKQWVYTSAATKLCCTVALLCGAVLLCYCAVLCCCVTVVAPSSNYNTSCYTTVYTVGLNSGFIPLLRYCAVLYCCVTVAAPSSNYNTSCYTTGLTPEGILRGCVLLVWSSVCSVP